MTKRTPRVELVYERSCPNISAARDQLKSAFESAGLDPQWTEWDTARPDSPQHLSRYGSPTILVEGADVAPETGNDAACCRVYIDSESANKGIPPLERIVSALRGESETPAADG